MPLVSPYVNNASRVIQATTVGFKISKPGYDARRTAGANMVFDSSWPSLPIAYETTLLNNAATTIAHPLKFPPLTFIFITNPDAGGLGTTTTRVIATVSDTLVKVPAGQITNIKCFQLDLTQDLDYVLAPGDTYRQPYDPNFGVKVVKPNRDITSRDLRDFAVHSRAQSPLILGVKTEKTMDPANVGSAIGNVVQYSSKLNYPVWIYGFIKAGATLSTNLGMPLNSYVHAPYYSQSYPRTITDGLTAYIGYQQGTNADNGATLVILRDPMFAATSTTVQY